MDERTRRSRKRITTENTGICTVSSKNGLPKRRKKKKRRYAGKLPAGFKMIFAGSAAVLMSVYCLFGLNYKSKFLPNTMIGGIPASGLTADEVKKQLDGAVGRYELVLEERGGSEERICGSEIGLSPIYDGTMEAILKEQKPLLWGLRYFGGKKEYLPVSSVVFDREKLAAAINSLDCMDPELITEPADAFLTWEPENGLSIVPEELGNAPVPERLSEEIANAVSGLKSRISLDESGIYKKPDITGEDPGLISRKEAFKPYADVTVTYRFGSRSEVLDGSRTLNWLVEGRDGEVTVKMEAAEAYVQELAEKYNTAYRPKELKTSYGPAVTITKGHYGWMIDKEKEAAALVEMIEGGESREREPIYRQTAASHDGPDYGDTYVEMNLTAQHLYFYKEGKLLIESDFVSGNESKGWSTPAGAYELTYKQRNAVLRGKNYNTPVTYWMPFNGNIGMHDGYWRTSFGGTIYKKNGSHGCINLPPAVAKTIYENIKAGIPVLCYHLEGTENGKTTSVPAGKAPSSSSSSGTGNAAQGGTAAQPENKNGTAGQQSSRPEAPQQGNQPGTAESRENQPGVQSPVNPSGTEQPQAGQPGMEQPQAGQPGTAGTLANQPTVQFPGIPSESAQSPDGGQGPAGPGNTVGREDGQPVIPPVGQSTAPQ